MIDVTVIMASYNKQKFISETIDSVLEQTYEDWELIIVDDCSTDETVRTIEQKVSDKRIRLIKSDINRGANFCRNLGIKEAKSEYIIFLDADDLLTRDCIRNRIMHAKNEPESNLLVFTMGVFYKKPGDDNRKWEPKSKDPLKDFLQHKLPWSILQPLWKKNFLIELGGFDEAFQRLQDVELNTRALLHKQVIYKLINTEPDCYYRIDEGRKNFDSFNFLKRRLNSSLQYCDKFKERVKKRERSYLLGTLYHTLIQLIHQLKSKGISKSEFSTLMESVNSYSMVNDLSVTKRSIWKLAVFYNLYLLRLPGINRLFLRIVTA